MASSGNIGIYWSLGYFPFVFSKESEGTMGKKSSNPKRLGFESLESRIALAGNVAASVSGGLLVLTGDNSANALQVTQVGTNRWQVLGLGTKVNSSYTAKTFKNVTGIISELRGGNDSIVVSNGKMANVLAIDTGTGHDSVVVSRVTAGEIYADTKSGNDSVSIVNSTATDILGVDTGDGTDSVALNTVKTKYLGVALGGGNNDVVSVVKSRATLAEFDGGAGKRDVLIRSGNKFGSQKVIGFETRI